VNYIFVDIDNVNTSYFALKNKVKNAYVIGVGVNINSLELHEEMCDELIHITMSATKNLADFIITSEVTRYLHKATFVE